MIVSCTGIAVIQDKASKQNFRIESSELDWNQESGSELSMGAEICYEALIEHEILGRLSWRLYEYPVGVQNYKVSDVNGHAVISDFSFELLHDKDDHESDETNAQVEVIVEWFHENFEDPAEQTPYESAEGGYIYIWGGPFDAHDVISDQFHDYSDQIIDEAVATVEHDGIIDWAPKDGSSYHNATTDDYDNDVEYSNKPSKQELVGQIQELQSLLEPILTANPWMGHNNPPKDDMANEITIQEFGELNSIADELIIAAESEEGEKSLLINIIDRFLSLGNAIKNWLWERIRKALDKYAEAGVLIVSGKLIENGPEILDSLTSLLENLVRFIN